MLLIDALEERSDSVKILELVSDSFVRYDAPLSKWWITVEGAEYELTTQALENLLNLLRIPIKFIYRCLEDDDGGVQVAQVAINYWLSLQGELSYLVEGSASPIITQVYAGKRLYLPSVKVNDLILDYLKFNAVVESYVVDGDIFNALYITDKVHEIDDEKFLLGIRVLYSDCFTITPRFDGVIYNRDTGALFGWPTTGRKFRVASTTIPQVIDQIEEFIDLSLYGLTETLIPALKRLFEDQNLLTDAEGFITRLCNDLRYSKKVRDELIANCTQYPNHLPEELLRNIAAYTNRLPEETNIDIAMARDIQIALSNQAVKGSFK